MTRVPAREEGETLDLVAQANRSSMRGQLTCDRTPLRTLFAEDYGAEARAKGAWP